MSRPWSRRRALPFLVASTASAGAAWLISLELHRSGPPPLTGSTPALVAILGVALVVAELRPPSWLTFGEQSVSMSWVISLSIVLCGATAGALLLTGLATFVNGAIRRGRLSSTVFNSAQVIVSLACGIWVLRATGALDQLLPRHSPDGLRWDVAVLLAGAAVYATNAVLVAGAFRLLRGAPFFVTLAEGLRVNVLGDGVLMALAPVVVVVGQRSLAILPFVGLTAVGVYGVARLAMVHGHAATHDALTALANRRGFEERAGDLVERAGPDQVGVLLVDLDHFKPVNDQYGHATGDAVLIEVAHRLRTCLPRSAVIARLGGDEFAAAVTAGATAALALAELLAEQLRQPIDVDGRLLAIGASIGLSVGDGDLRRLLGDADAAMYRAKAHGLGLCVAGAADPLGGQHEPPATAAGSAR